MAPNRCSSSGAERSSASGSPAFAWPASEPSHAPARPQLPRLEAPVAASALTIGGTAAFAVGATAGPWPLWVAGMIAVCVSLVLYRP